MVRAKEKCRSTSVQSHVMSCPTGCLESLRENAAHAWNHHPVVWPLPEQFLPKLAWTLECSRQNQCRSCRSCSCCADAQAVNLRCPADLRLGRLHFGHKDIARVEAVADRMQRHCSSHHVFHLGFLLSSKISHYLCNVWRSCWVMLNIGFKRIYI